MNVRVKLTPDFIFCHNVSSSERHLFENFFDATYTKAKSAWRIPMNLWSMRELVKTFPQLAHDQEFVKHGKELKQELDHLLQVRSYAFNCKGDRLRPYQREDVMYLTHLPAAGIFNEPRTGKTPTAITLLKELKTKRNIIISPASLIWNWEKEVKEWYPEISVTVVTGTAAKRRTSYTSWKEGVLIVSKDTLKNDAEWIHSMQFDTCLVDEAHFLRNWKTKQSEAVCGVKSIRRYALTGTPTVKHPSDVYGILKFLYPSRFPSYWQFVERYFGTQANFMGRLEVVSSVKPHRKEELQQMVGMLSVQRKRKEVMNWLPDKTRMVIPCRMDTKQEKLYKDMKEFFQTFDTEVEISAANVLTQLTRMRQLCLDPRLLGLELQGCKTQAILEWLDDNREPVVIMSMFTSYLKLLEPEIKKLGLRVGFIHGEMSNKEKQDSASHFQCGGYDVLLCNIVSAGTGFTLDAGNTVIFTDKAWNPSDNEQAEDRVCPTTIERNHKHTIISFEVAGTVDSKINRILDTKKSLTDIINEGGREAIRQLLEG